MSSTARFVLPLLTAGQAQKEIFVNEAVTLIDALVQPCVESAGEDTPPADPLPGQCWVVGAAPEAPWTGAAGKLAIWTANGWRYVEPREGMAVHVRSEGVIARYVDGVWQIGTVAAHEFRVEGQRVVGPRQPAIGDPSGGAVVDAEARDTIAALLDTLRAHGLIAA